MKKLLNSSIILFILVISSSKAFAGGGGGGGTPTATSLSCGSSVTLNLDASGFAGGNPTSGDAGCNPCCYAGADLDGDGLQDVPFSVENSEWYQYCNSTGAAVTVTFTADETGTGASCNIQGASWVGAALDATTLDCGNSGYQYFDSNPGGAADGFSFTVTIPNGQCGFFMVDGYGGATCNPVTISITCPCTTPVATATPSTQTICSGSATSIALSSTVSGTTYAWTVSQSGVSGASNGSGSTIAQTLTATGTTAGTATYTITPTASGCVGAPITVTITVNPKPVMTSASTATICSGGTVNIPLTSNVAATYTWIAANNANTAGESTTTQSSNTLNNTITNSSTSVQTVTYTVTPTSTTGGCVGTTQTVTVTVNPVPAMTSASTATICSGGTVSIPLTSNVASTYTWIAANNANTTGESTTTQTTSTLSNTIINTTTSAQTVTYTVTPTSSAGACLGTTQTVTVTVNPAPTMTSATTATICSGGTVSIPLTSDIAATYTWIAANNANTTGESTTTQSTSTLSNTITNSTSTAQTVTYTVTPTATSGGCVGATQTVTVTVNPLPTMTSASTATICSGATVSIPLTSDNPSTYTWIAANNANTTGESTTLQSTSTLSNTITNTSTSVQTVTYTVTPTSTAGTCVGNTQTVTVTVNPVPAMTSASTATICSGGTVSIPLTSNVASSYTWIAANNANTTGESTTLQSTSTLSNTITNTSSAVQVVTYTVTPTSTAGSCLGTTQTVTVTVNPAPTMTSASSATICSGATVSIALTSDIASTYTWIAANNANTSGESTTLQSTGTLSNTITNTSAVAQVVTYTVTPTSTPTGCLGNTQTVNVTVNPPDNASFSYASSTYCQTGTNPTPTITGLAGGTFSSTAGLVFVSTATGQINLAGSTLGTYTVTYTTTGPCPNTATFNVTITTAPSAAFSYAGPYCQSDPDPLPTFGAGASAGTFSSTAGLVFISSATGQIDVSASTAGTYTVTNSIAAAGGCGASSATASVTINPIATVNAGADQASCASSPAVVLAGVIGGSATGGTWSGGTGTFTPASTSLTATYTPSAAEITAGTVTLTLTTNDPAGPCPAVTDQMIITINPAATVSAGTDQTSCASSPTVTLAGVVGGAATSGSWSGGAGTFTPGSTTLNATYTPTAAEISAGTVTLTLTTNDPAGPCPAVTDQMIITINPIATVSAGADQTSCSSSAAVTLAGTVGGSATSGTWSGGTGTFTPSASALGATYTPSAAEITAGTVTLTLSTNDPAGPCAAVTDQMTITINTPATASAGADQTSCGTSPGVTLSGVIGGSAGSGTWSGGTGTFTPDNLTLNATYTPSAAEITAGTVTLTLTTDDPSGPCPAVTDQMVITIDAPATANAGADQSICGSGATVTLAGSVGGSAISGSWSGGAGTFTPNSSTLNATYTPTAAEIAAGGLVLTLTTNDPAGPCSAVTDQMAIAIDPVATVDAGADQTVCASSPTITLAGLTGGSASSGTWSGGSGTFSPNNTTLNATYTPSAAELTAGTVTLTLTTNDPTGPCPAVTDQMTITITPLDNASFSYASSTYCITGTDPSATITGLTGGTFTATGGLVIDPVTGLIDLSANPLATYTVTYSTNGACPNTSTFDVTITNAPSAQFSYSGPYCASAANPVPSFGAGASAGTFTSMPSGLIFVSNLTGEIDIAASTPGTYTVINDIPAGGGCAAAADTVTVTIDASATVTASSDASICEGNNYTLGGGFGGSASSVLWSTSGTGTFNDNTLGNAIYTPSAADIASGSVTLTILTNDPAGACSAEVDDMILTINPQDSAGFNYGGSTFCQTGGNPVPVLASAGIFSSSPSGLNFVDNVTGEIDIAGSTLGTYTITYITNGTCPDTSTATITITLSPSAAFSYAGPYCPGGINPLPSFGAGSSGGTFTSVGGLTFVSSSSGEIDLSVSAPGTYTVINTIPASGGCAMAVDSAIVTINALPNVNAGADQVLTCVDTTVNLLGSSSTVGATFSWSGGTIVSGGSTATPVVSAVGTYTLTVTAGGCSDIDTAYVSENLLAPDVDAGADQTLTCTALTAVLNGSSLTPGVTYFWTGGTIVSGDSTSAPTVSATGVYTLMATNPANGCFSVDTVTVISNTTPPNANAGSDQVITCSTASATLSGSSSTPGATFNWSGGTIVSGGTTASPVVSSIGTYVLTITDTVNGCTSTDTAMVSANTNAPDANAGSDQVVTCAAPTTTLSGSSATAGTTFSWSGGTIVSGGTTATPLVSGTGTYVLTVTDSASGCTSTDTALVTGNTTPPDANAGTAQSITCANTTATLTGSSLTAGATFSWAGGTIVSGGTTASPVVSTAGTYTVTVTDPSNGCTATSTVLVNLNNTPPVADAGTIQMVGCGVLNVTLNGSGSASGTGITYNWTTVAGNIVSGASGTSPVVDQTGVYTITVTDAATGCSATDTVSVLTAPGPVASFTASPTSGIHPLPVDFTNTSSNANTYSWSFGDGNISSLTNPSNTYGVAGTYVVTLIASNNSQCPDTVQSTIVVFDDLTLIIPNIFTPNGDNFNDLFMVTGTGIDTFKGTIYDRWGLKLFEWEKVDQGWDGRTSSGSIASDGTYYYIITAAGFDGKEHTYTGFIQLLK
jgi:gliding motility-associated-like protein